MEPESFYGVTLSEKEPLAQFDVSESGDDSSSYGHQKLVIKQICLDADAKNGEFNVVQAETIVNDVEKLKIPIAVLKAGETRVLRPNIEFPSSSVTFKLIQGTGPVHICGQHMVDISEQEDWQSDIEDDLDDDDAEDEPPPPQTNGKNSNKKK